MPITLEQLNLTPAEMKEILVGAQTYLAPQADPADEEHLLPPADVEELTIRPVKSPLL